MMAQQYATDEAGNVWDVSGPTPVFVSAAAGAPTAVAPNQLKVQAAQQDLSNDRIQGARTAQQIALEAAKVPYSDQVAAAEARKATADAAKAERELATAPAMSKDQADQKGRMTRLISLAKQINRVQELYSAGPGKTKGLAGLADYLPTDANERLDTAGASLSEQGLGAFRVPGTGEVSNRDAIMFEKANLPSSGARDVRVEEQLRGLRARVDEEFKALGAAPFRWEGAASASPADQHRQNDPRMATIGNAGPPSGGNPQGPRGYDVGGIAGGVGAPRPGGGGFSNAAGLEMAQRLSKAYTAGADVSALNKILRENGYQEFTDPQSIAAIQKRGPLNFAPPQVDDSRSGLGRAIGDNLNTSVGAYGVAAADALTAGNLDTLGGGQTKLAQQYLEKNNPTASLLGTVTGGALAAGGAELGLARAGLSAGRAALAGDALYGGAYGAGSADGGNRLLGALAGATGGAVGGIAGRGVASGVGRVARGVQNADVAALRQAGIPTTVGQTLGGTAKGVEDRLAGLPLVGDMVNARRLEGMQAFNRTAFNEGLAPINANTGGAIGEQGVDAALDATKGGYRQALDNVSVTREPQFTGEYNAAVAQGTQVPRVGPEFEAWAQANLDPLVASPQIGGAQIQDFLQQTRGADFGNDAMGSLVGRSVSGAEDAMRGLVQRQSPGTIPALAKADQAYRQVQVLRDAVNRARNGTRTGETGIFAPSQLADAAAANAKKFGNSQGTTRQPFFDLTRAAQSVLPNSVPDSGTAGRAVVAGGLGLAGLGGGAGYAAGDTGTGAGTGLALAALLAAGGTKTGQKALVKALADRPDALVQFGNKVIRGSKYGGIFGAPLVAPIATGIVAQ